MGGLLGFLGISVAASALLIGAVHAFRIVEMVAEQIGGRMHAGHRKSSQPVVKGIQPNSIVEHRHHATQKGRNNRGRKRKGPGCLPPRRKRAHSQNLPV